jgi:hypothetical protein
MKKTIFAVMAALSITGAGSAIEVLKAEIRVGNLFNRFPKEMAVQAMVDESAKLKADKVSVQLIMHRHPKLGIDYTAVGTAWKCGK